eukprot:3766032-Rhodomonas_salina.1
MEVVAEALDGDAAAAICEHRRLLQVRSFPPPPRVDPAQREHFPHLPTRAARSVSDTRSKVGVGVLVCWCVGVLVCWCVGVWCWRHEEQGCGVSVGWCLGLGLTLGEVGKREGGRRERERERKGSLEGEVRGREEPRREGGEGEEVVRGCVSLGVCVWMVCDVKQWAYIPLRAMHESSREQASSDDRAKTKHKEESENKTNRRERERSEEEEEQSADLGEEAVHVEVRVAGDDDGVGLPREHIDLLDRDLVDLVVAVQALDVPPVALHQVDQLVDRRVFPGGRAADALHESEEVWRSLERCETKRAVCCVLCAVGARAVPVLSVCASVCLAGCPRAFGHAQRTRRSSSEQQRAANTALFLREACSERQRKAEGKWTNLKTISQLCIRYSLVAAFPSSGPRIA